MRRLWGLAAAGWWVSPALAADKLVIGPPAPWVKPVAIPADLGKSDDTAIRLVLEDEQYDLQPAAQTRYFETAYQIQTPQGLSSGAVTLAWNPDIQGLTVHKLLIRRGAQVIDVLASGQSFTVVRRESNLENAMLDGVLTATIQPEGLQVGDIVDFSATITNSDPAARGHVEQVAAGWNAMPIGHAHIRVQWPAALPLRFRETGGLAAPKPVRKDGLASVELSLDNVRPVVAPKGAPARFQYGRLIEMSDFKSWAGLAELMAPLYVKAATLPPQGPLQAEIARLRAASADPLARAAAALALVQTRVRYAFLGMNDGGLVPADAETTWSRRFGDCKGKTVLLLALLHALDIDAHPVLVSSALGDGIDQRLPMIGVFDHVLVRAAIAGRTYWLDGTRIGDLDLTRLKVPGFVWGLPLAPGSAALVPIMPPPLTEPGLTVTIDIDASAGISLPAPAHVERLIRGDDAVGTNIQLTNLAADARDRGLREFFKQKYDFIDVKSASAVFDPARRELKLTMDGAARMDWNDGYYEADGVWVGYKADFSRDPGPDRDAPYAVNYPYFTRVTEQILLPPDSGAFTVYKPAEVDRTVAGIEYHRHAEVTGNRFTVEERERSLVPEFPAADAPAAEAALRELARQTVYLKMPANYRLTKAEAAVALAKTPTTAAEFSAQGGLLLDQGRLDEAIASLDKAIALDPKNATTFAVRGMAHARKQQNVAAKADLDAAAAIDPHNAQMFHGREWLGIRTGAFKDVITAATSSLQIDAGDTFARSLRAYAYHDTGEEDLALADANQVIAEHPTEVSLRQLRANALHRAGKDDLAVKDADAIVAGNPGNVSSLLTASKIYSAAGRSAEAMHALDQALAIKPEAYLYVNRSEVRPKTDVAGQLADLDAALKLEAGLAEAPASTGNPNQRHTVADALATLQQAAIDAFDAMALAKRGIVHERAGQAALAARDFVAARAAAKTPATLNEICWEKATAGVALELALKECDAALALAPDSPPIVDSRALVLLRLGRIDEAIAAYGKAIAKMPTGASSLYGRGIAEARKGDKAAADRDMAAALKANPDIKDDYDGYGVTVAAIAGTGAAAPASAGSVKAR